MSDIPYKAYMGKTVIFHIYIYIYTLMMSNVIIVLYSYMVTMHMYVLVYVQECQRTQDSLQYMCIKNLVSYGWPLASAGPLSLTV